MLVLERRLDQSIIITFGGERIVVTVVEAKKGSVKLGVEASRHVQVDREEIDRAKRAAK